MKILTLDTKKTGTLGYEIDGGLTIFFVFTDEKYSALLVDLEQGRFTDMYEFYEYCKIDSEDFWNVGVFEADDELQLDATIWEITTQKKLSIID